MARISLFLFFVFHFGRVCNVHSQLQAENQERVALVIGVKDYKHVSALQNTLNDASDIANLLKRKGFRVIELYNPATKREMQDGVISYFRLLKENRNSVGMMFYSGHGLQVDGMNYLIPSSANLELKADLEDQCLNMDYVMSAIDEAKNPLNIFILDACRSNPFRGFYRSGEKGLSMVSTPQGSYIVYATKPGSVASDGSGRNGLFTSKLLKYIEEEGLNIEQVFKKVALDVAKESNDAQRPWIASDFTGDFFFSPNKNQGKQGDSEEQIVFFDQFDNNNQGWYTGSDHQHEIQLKQGKLVMHSKNGGSWFVNKPMEIAIERDYEISTSVKKISGTDDYYFGLILGGNTNTGEFYFLGITGVGNVTFALHKTKTAEEFIPTDRRLSINNGNELNKLRLRKQLGLITIFVNDQLVATVPEKIFKGPMFGFRIWSGSSDLKVEFDDLKFVYL